MGDRKIRRSRPSFPHRRRFPRMHPVSFSISLFVVSSTCAAVLAAAEPADKQPLTVAALCSGQGKIIDLTYPLNERSAYWPGENYEPFRLKTLATLEKNGVLSKAFSMPEHLG